MTLSPTLILIIWAALLSVIPSELAVFGDGNGIYLSANIPSVFLAAGVASKVRCTRQKL
jgi:hypothetical protein